MNRQVIIVGLVSGALAFAVGFIGGAVLNRPSRQNYDAKVSKIRSGAQQDKQHTAQKLRQEQAIVKKLQREIIQLKTELMNMNLALVKANKKVREQKAELFPPDISGSHIGSAKTRSEINTRGQLDALKTILPNPIFGIRLGENITSLKRRNSISQSSYKFEDEDHPGLIWDLRNSDKTIKAIRVYTYQQRIYRIGIDFADSSEANFEAIKNNLKTKYQEQKKQGLIDTMFGEFSFVTQINNVAISVNLNRDLGFGDNKLQLTYLHNPLFSAVQSEIQRRKTAKVGNRL